MKEKVVNFFINCLEDDLLVEEITKINKIEDLFKFYQKYNSECTEEEFNTVIEEILKMSELDENSLEKVSGGLSGKRATSTALSVAMLVTPFLAPATKAGKVIENPSKYVLEREEEDEGKSFLEKHWSKLAVGGTVGVLALWGFSKLRQSDNSQTSQQQQNNHGGNAGGRTQTPKPNFKKFSELVDNYKKIDININESVRDRIHVIIGDITKIQTENDIKVDAIVNAANKKMRGGGGVDGSVHSAAGSELYNYECNNFLCEACQKKKSTNSNVGCKCGQDISDTGKALATPAFNLANQGQKCIIHTVAPQNLTPATDDKCDLMKNCYENSIYSAFCNDCQSIAFPPLGVGIFECDLATSTNIAWKTVEQELLKYTDMHVYFTCIPFIGGKADDVINTVAIYKAFAEKNEGIEIIDKQNYLKNGVYANKKN